ncbi:MAG: thiamine pyrophosphate-dependent dehydrogenase E1 component subunit alpha [Pseudomonadota bacterium]
MTATIPVPGNAEGSARQLAYRLVFQTKRIRMVEEAIADRYTEWKMRCPTHLSIGQEAVSAAVGEALRRNDLAVSGHRAHGHYLGKGGDLKRMIAEIYGKATGCCAGKGGSMHLVDLDAGFVGSTAIVSGTIPVGVGLGLSIQLKRTDQVSVVFFGDGAIEEGVFYESVNFAALKRLPVLFVCENNMYSVYSPLHVRQPVGRRIHDMVSAMGVPSRHGNGNDVRQVYDMTREAVEKIRQGGGPHFLEFETYRWREHCGPNYDNDIGYRSPEEFESWKYHDPVITAERWYVEQQGGTPEQLRTMESLICQEIDDAFQFAEQSPFPEQDEAFTRLFKP